MARQKYRNNSFLKRLIVDKKKINDIKTIANKLNEFSVKIGPRLASLIPKSDISFESYVPKSATTLRENTLSQEEFEKAFNTLKRNKAPCFDDVHVKIIKSVYNYIKIPLKRIFENSIQTGIFPEKMKIAKITPIFKSGQEELLTNYRPISVLPCFSKILERIMYNRLYTYLTENNLLFEKQFGFRSGHSTKHALVELIDKIHDVFNKNSYTLGKFIDLSLAFDTVDHEILLKKLYLYCVLGNSLKWFDSYLSNRKQYIEYCKISTDLLDIKCGIPQGSILGPLLFIIYVNNLYKVSTLLEPVMFADNTNLFLSHKNIKNYLKQPVQSWKRFTNGLKQTNFL